MDFVDLFDRLSGVILIIGGVYGLLFTYRILPRNQKDTENAELELWHRKFDKIMKILSPIIILFGILLLLGVL